MLRAGLRNAAQTAFRRSHSRHISNDPHIVRYNVLRKIKKGIDRLPSQGPDPASSFKHGWRLACAAVIERYPVVTPDCDPFESEYLTGRFLEMQRRARPISPALFLTEKDIMEGRTKPDLSDPYADMYQPAPRKTEADRTGDRRSLERALDERLYFLVKRGEKGRFQFPQILAADKGVPLNRYAELAWRGVTGTGRPDVHFVSGTPACHLEHVYPVEYQRKHDVYGVKVFFYRGMLMQGEVDGVRNAVDFVWARERELAELLGAEVRKAVQPILLGVGPTVRSKDLFGEEETVGTAPSA